MKTIFRVSALGLLLFTVVAVTNQTALAQGESDLKNKLYKSVTDNYAGNLEERKIALKAGKEYLEKYGDDAENQAVIDWLNGALPEIEDGIKLEEKEVERKARFKKFDSAYKGKNWESAFEAGSEILKFEPNYYDVAIVLASRGYTEAYDQKDAHNGEAIQYAKLAIDQMKSGKESKSGLYGGYDFQYKDKEFPDGKANALGWMNYYIGWIMFYRMDQKDAAIPYFFEATKFNSGAKEYDITYRAFGQWYVAKLAKKLEKRNALLAERNAEAEAESPDAEKVKALDVRIDDLIAEERGYAERAIDAYSRAYDALSKEDKSSEYGRKTFTRLQELYKLRYEEPEMQSVAKIQKNVAMISKKAMPDPNSEVEPIDKVAPADSAEKPEDGKAGASRERTVSDNEPAGTSNR